MPEIKITVTTTGKTRIPESFDDYLFIGTYSGHGIVSSMYCRIILLEIPVLS
jgi:hypothetical protein